MGFAIVLTVCTRQSGDFAVVNDVTITNNVLKNVVSGFNTLAKDDTCGPGGLYPNCKMQAHKILENCGQPDLVLRPVKSWGDSGTS